MVTRYEFGYGEGEIGRRRRRGQENMRRRAMESAREFPDRSAGRLGYESDYYGFRGAGSRGRGRPPRRPRRRGIPPGDFRRAGRPRQWGRR